MRSWQKVTYLCKKIDIFRRNQMHQLEFQLPVSRIMREKYLKLAIFLFLWHVRYILTYDLKSNVCIKVNLAKNINYEYKNI